MAQKRKVRSITRDVKNTYLFGDCWLLAYALWERGAGDLAMLHEEHQPETWTHIFIQTHDDECLDVLGHSTRDEMINSIHAKTLNAPVITVLTETEFREYTAHEEPAWGWFDHAEVAALVDAQFSLS